MKRLIWLKIDGSAQPMLLDAGKFRTDSLEVQGSSIPDVFLVQAIRVSRVFPAFHLFHAKARGSK